MAEAGVTFDQDGNLVVTTIVPPSEFPTAGIPSNVAQAIIDAKAAADAAEEAEQDADKVLVDLGEQAQPDTETDSPPAEPTPPAAEAAT
jgi:hypothetical protein